MKATDEDGKVEQVLQQQIGPALQQARVAQGLTQADIANQLNLKIETIEQLESDNFDEIISPTYVKGYLRSYARLVKIDSTELINEYQNREPKEAQRKSRLKGLTSKNVMESGDKKIALVSYILILFILALIGYWWWQGETSSTSLSQVIEEQAEQRHQNS